MFTTNAKFTYVVDFFNVFSDYREMLYKRQNIDFHTVKHKTKEEDALAFFDMFFNRYMPYVTKRNMNDVQFVFVMKKLFRFEKTLMKALQNNNHDIHVIIIKDKYESAIVDSNKDDFVCQYCFHLLQKNRKCALISNDKYRDNTTYVDHFNFDIPINVMSRNMITNNVYMYDTSLKVDKHIRSKIIASKECMRCAIPKGKLLATVC